MAWKTKLKINTQYKIPEQLPGESFFDMTRRVGARTIRVTGKIGAGTKIHKFTAEVVDTEYGLGVLSVWSLCGSAKWNSRVSPVFDTDFECNCKRCNNYYTHTNNKKGDNTMIKATVKTIKAAIDQINETGILAPEVITYPTKATKANLTNTFISCIGSVDAAGKLDEVPADAWDTYRVLVPKDSEPENRDGKTEVNYDDTPEGQAAAKEKGHFGHDVGPADAAKTKADGKVRARSKAVENKDGTKSVKRITKAVAFWETLNTKPLWNRADLIEALRLAHGNGSQANAEFWTVNYVNLLAAAGLVEVTSGKTIRVV